MIETPAETEFRLSLGLFFFGLAALMATAVLAPQFDDLTWEMLAVPFWGIVAIFLAIRVRRGRVGNILYYFAVGWLTIALLLGYYAQFADA